MRDLLRLTRGGLLLTVWAYAAGWPPGRLRGLLRREKWQWICRGAWAVPGKEVDWAVRARVVQLLRPPLVCSHGTAALLHRIELLNRDFPGVLEFTTLQPGGGTRGGDGHTERACADGTGRGANGTGRGGIDIRLHRTVRLEAREVCLRSGLRVTSPARTVGDLIRQCGTREEAVVVADSALSRRTVRGVRREPLVHHEELAAELSARRPGAPLARRRLALAEAASGSPAETIARLHLRDAGLHPECQPLLHTSSGRALRPDFFFRRAGLAVEIEGYAFHGTREAHARDVARFNALADCPDIDRVLRFTALDVFHHPDRVVSTIKGALGQLG
ncbi:endonuclease domain-containing protein [Streptomyces sp. JL2001]|uniref:endonuclease domain-containing protein n=1 Tax=Streptomyces sp. JL2001 TaxID=3342488 RepID=UPI003D80527E